MTHYRRKPFAGRRREDAGLRHWLEEGSIGQESLMLEFDPYLYVLDQSVSTVASSVAHESDHRSEKPYAVLVPLPETIGWQLGYLSKQFNVYVWSEGFDDVLSAAADRFNAKLIDGELQSELEHEIDLFLCTDYTWSGPAQFAKSVREVRKLLSPDGRAGFVLIGSGNAAGVSLTWTKGENSTLDELEDGRIADGAMPLQVRPLCLAKFDVHDALPVFLKRNRDFFGRNMREVFLQRFEEGDLQGCFTAGAAPALWAIFAVWGAVEDTGGKRA